MDQSEAPLIGDKNNRVSNEDLPMHQPGEAGY